MTRRAAPRPGAVWLVPKPRRPPRPRPRIYIARNAVITQTYVEGVSTRRVKDLVAALGGTWINKPKVSRMCAQPEAAVARSRLLRKPHPQILANAHVH